MAQTSNPDREGPDPPHLLRGVPPATCPKHFAADGDLILSHVAASLSAVFPDGEDFFVRSVRNFRDQITDPELKRQVAGFIGQEAMHGREHRAFNDRLDRARLPDQALRAVHEEGPRASASGCCRRRRTSPPPPRSSTSPPPWPSWCSPTRRRGHLFGHEAVEEPVPVARAGGVRAQGRRVRRLQGGRRQRAGPRVDDEPPHVRLRRRHGRAGRRLAARSTARPTGAGNLRQSWRRFRRSPIMHASSGTSCGTTTGPTSTLTTATRPSSSQRWRAELFGEDGHAERQARRAAAA